MKNNITELVFILDRSGSMANMVSDTVGGFNSTLKKQKEIDEKAYVSLVLFNDRSQVVYDRADIREVKNLNEEDYYPAGCTALLDAVGDAIHHIGNVHKYARREDVPDKTVFVIITDGMENASRRYTYADVKKKISHEKEKYGWEFLFLGANINAEVEADKLGIDRDRAVNYHCDTKGMQVTYEAVTAFCTQMRAPKQTRDNNWRKKVDEDYNKRGKK